MPYTFAPGEHNRGTHCQGRCAGLATRDCDLHISRWHTVAGLHISRCHNAAGVHISRCHTAAGLHISHRGGVAGLHNLSDQSAFLGAARLLQMLCALATTLGLRLTASGPTGGHRCVRGHRPDGVDLACGRGVWNCGFSARRGLRTPSPSGVFRLLHPPILGAQARTHAELRSDGVPDAHNGPPSADLS